METQFKPLLIELLKNQSGLEYIQAMLYYLSNTTDDLDKNEVIHFFQTLPAESIKKEKIMTLAEQWREEGWEKGLEKGIEKGIEKGQHNLIEKQLKLKFGKIPAAFQGELQRCTTDQLFILSERILTCNTIEDIFDRISS